MGRTDGIGDRIKAPTPAELAWRERQQMPLRFIGSIDPPRVDLGIPPYDSVRAELDNPIQRARDEIAAAMRRGHEQAIAAALAVAEGMECGVAVWQWDEWAQEGGAMTLHTCARADVAIPAGEIHEHRFGDRPPA